MTQIKPLLNLLFLCTHNSARSILGEIIANTRSEGKFKAFSAGSAPSGNVNKFAYRIASEFGYPKIIFHQNRGMNLQNMMRQK